MIDDKIVTQLKNLVQTAQRILIIGIGEVNMGDDGFGPFIATHFHTLEKSNDRVLFMNGKTNYTERKQEILEFNPDLMIVLDTCESGDSPGTIILANQEQMVDWIPISSHVLPLQVFVQLIKQEIPSLTTVLLGVNPYSLDSPEQRLPYMPEKYDLDDFDSDPDLPFYKFSITDEMHSIIKQIIKTLEELLPVS